MGKHTIKQVEHFTATPQQVYAAYIDLTQHTVMTGADADGGSDVGGTMTAWG